MQLTASSSILNFNLFTKVMTSEEGTTMLKIVCNGEVLEQVNSFRYLGTSTGDCTAIAIGLRKICYYLLELDVEGSGLK